MFTNEKSSHWIEWSMDIFPIMYDDKMKITRIQYSRAMRNWTLKELASFAGVSLSTVQRAETGREISLSHGISIAKALGCKVETLWRVQ